jgi:hypothetical protein
MESMFRSPQNRPSRSLSQLRLIKLAGVVALLTALPGMLLAETCTTQSQMAPADRSALTATALSFAGWVKSNDAAGVKASTIPEFAQNFDTIATAITITAPKIAGDALAVTGLYILDATSYTGTKDAQFFCTLNASTSEAIFSLPSLPAGRYALATVRAQGAAATWNLSFVLRQSGSTWQLAGFIPKPATAAGHDGLWYWTQARIYAKQKQRWNAWLYYVEADVLLSPVDFVSSTNRDKLRAEQTDAIPLPLQANGISAASPLTVGTFAFTAIGTQEPLDERSLELALHITATDVSNPAAARARSMLAVAALLAAYPELRSAFSGAWVYSEVPGQSPFGIEFNPLPAPAP